MVCNVIEECRCYAYDDVRNPKKEQFCGVRKGPHVIPCPKDCCAGGCPGKIPKQPFRIIKRTNTKKSRTGLNQMEIKVLMYLAVILVCIFLLLL